MKKFKNFCNKAFTLVELVVVIAVIAVLAGVSVAAYFGVTDSAKKSALTSKQEQIDTLLLTYQIENDVNLKELSKSELNQTFLGFANYVYDNGIPEGTYKYRVVELKKTSNMTTQLSTAHYLVFLLNGVQLTSHYIQAIN